MQLVLLPPCPARPCPPPLVGDEIHVWTVPLDPAPATVADLLAELTADERARGDRYRAARVREQFVTCRGLLRRVLGGYLGVPAGDVPIAYTGAGKPMLAGGAFEFNLAHTDGVALIAVAGRPVGVDVERVRDVANAGGLVDRFFSAAERDDYRRLPEGVKREAFFRGWTCKEAVIKAAGASVEALDAFDVDLDPANPPVVRAARHPAIAAGRWAVSCWGPPGGYAAAVAVSS